MKLLIVVDMQNDFIDGALGTKEAEAIVPNVVKKINEYPGMIIFTRDTHYSNYLESNEGKNLPVPHCIKGTQGWEISSKLPIPDGAAIIDKETFGSKDLGTVLLELNAKEPVEEIELIGLCTDICVISNVIIAKAFLPEAKIVVDSSCCAGVTPKTHNNALEAMKVCQVSVI